MGRDLGDQIYTIHNKVEDILTMSVNDTFNNDLNILGPGMPSFPCPDAYLDYQVPDFFIASYLSGAQLSYPADLRCMWAMAPWLQGSVCMGGAHFAAENARPLEVQYQFVPLWATARRQPCRHPLMKGWGKGKRKREVNYIMCSTTRRRLPDGYPSS